MLDAASTMLTETLETPTNLAVKLLTHYSFDLHGCSASGLIERWLKDYADRWIYLAVVEALHQGRYKAHSVEQILAIWQRKGQPYFRFNHEFERLVCGNFSPSWRKGDRTFEEKTPQKLDMTKIKLLTRQSNNQGDSNPKLANQPIEQFNPHPTDTKEFYGKLKAIAKNNP